tara:strand:- start:191 stop:448 length:258 start_codon:yes stop_codon:yes gene_type:complete
MNLLHFAFLPNLNGFELLAILFVLTLWFVPTWMILKKTGYHPALSLLIIIPFVNIILILFVAFSEWPVHKELKYLKAKVYDRESQ